MGPLAFLALFQAMMNLSQGHHKGASLLHRSRWGEYMVGKQRRKMLIMSSSIVQHCATSAGKLESTFAQHQQPLLLLSSLVKLHQFILSFIINDCK